MAGVLPEGEFQTEFVRLSIKLDMVQWPFDNITASRILQGIGYRPIEERPDLVRMGRADGEFSMDRPRQIIRFDGFPLSAVVGAKKSFEESLKVNTGVVLGDYAAYYESDYILIYLAKKSMEDILSSVYSDSNHMESIRNIVGKDIRPSCIDMSSHGSHYNKTWFRIRIEPRAEGTEKTYFCSAAYRDTDIDSVIGDTEGAAEVVKRLLHMLEEGVTRKSNA